MTIHHPIVLLDGADRANGLWNRVLVVIRELGYEAVSARPEETLPQAMARVSPDVVLIAARAATLADVRALKERESLTRVPLLVVGEAPSLDEVTEMVEAGVEDWLRVGTPDGLLAARIRTAVKTKFFYDNVVRIASEESLRDPLTGLWNHRRFQDHLRIEITRAEQGQRPVSLLMLDLDRFKSINDRYGHPVGDEVIRAAAEAMKESVRAGDILARYGGEEFSVILPGAGRAQAFAIADRICATLRERRISGAGHEIETSASIGVSVFPEDALRSSNLIAAADLALYQAKREGRDRYESVRWTPFAYATPAPMEFVGVGGDWNAWAPERAPLIPEEAARPAEHWMGQVLLPTGKNRYKFKIRPNRTLTDYRWLTDPRNPQREADGFGGTNSILLVERY